MSNAAQNSFIPPTAEQVSAHLERYPLMPPSRVQALLPLVTLGALILMSVTLFMGSSSPLLSLFTLAIAGALVGVMIYSGARGRKVRGLDARVTGVQELALLRRYPESLREAWAVLPQTQRIPELHGRTVAAIAHVLDRLRCYEAALVAYDYLVARVSDEQPLGLLLRVQRVPALLGVDRLTDADDVLRRTRGGVEELPGTPVSASYRFASLLQQAHTHHFEDATESADTLLADLRPMGVEAGYGHALMALAFQQLNRHGAEDSPRLREQAAMWWSRATLLLPVEALVGRYAQLSEVASDPTCPASPSRPEPSWSPPA